MDATERFSNRVEDYAFFDDFEVDGFSPLSGLFRSWLVWFY